MTAVRGPRNYAHNCHASGSHSYTNVLILETSFDNVVERRGAIHFVFNS